MYGEIQFDNYNFTPETYVPFVGYGQSKTANIYMANEIENRYAAQGLHGISLYPGGIWTGLQKYVDEKTWAEWKERPGVDNYIKSSAQGAATTVLAAVGKEFEGTGRCYLVDCERVPEDKRGDEGVAPWAFDKEKEGRLWKDSLKMVGLPEDS